MQLRNIFTLLGSSRIPSALQLITDILAQSIGKGGMEALRPKADILAGFVIVVLFRLLRVPLVDASEGRISSRVNPRRLHHLP
jgi:hypothetical protein